MNRKSREPDHTPFIDAEPELVSRFLRLALDSEQRPVKRLVDRLLEPDGPSWFDGQLAKSPGLSAEASLESLRTIKDDARRKARESAMVPESLLRYFLAIGLALHHHQIRMTRAEPELLAASLVELAEVTPGPWNHMLRDAAMKAVDRAAG